MYPVTCSFVARPSFVLLAWFLHHMEGLELNFHLILALLEYLAACAFGTGSNITLIAIEHNVKRSRLSAGMYPSCDVTLDYHVQYACHAYFCLIKLNRTICILCFFEHNLLTLVLATHSVETTTRGIPTMYVRLGFYHVVAMVVQTISLPVPHLILSKPCRTITPCHVS